jgi:hypothetical protein
LLARTVPLPAALFLAASAAIAGLAFGVLLAAID